MTFKDNGVGSRWNILNHRRLLGNVSQKQNKLHKTQYILAYKALNWIVEMMVMALGETCLNKEEGYH
jgi:hypothetical protein